MFKTQLHVVSSSGGTYLVEFHEKNGALKIFCHCEAGMNGMLCKHKISLGRGLPDLLADDNDRRVFSELLTNPLWDGLHQILTNYWEEFNQLEKAISRLKAQEKELKKSTFHDITF